MGKTFKYKSNFAGKINKISGQELDKYVSLAANLDALKSLLPNNVDLSNNPDLIGIVGNAAVANRMNLNGDAIDGKTALAIAKNFIWKFCDVNHERHKIAGVICNYGFSKFGSNEIITEEQAAGLNEPFNLSLATLIYAILVPESFIKLIEESADPTSENFGVLSYSWELLFDEYDICVGSKNVNEAEIITDPIKKEELEPILRCNGGTGTKDGKLVYRLIKEASLIPTGVGLVEFPAAEVKGISLLNPIDKEKTEEAVNTSKLDELQNNTSDLKNSNVIKNSNVNVIMKIKTRQDITDEALKEATAADLNTLIDEELDKAAKEYKAQKESVEIKLKETQANLDKLTTDYNTLSEDFKKIKESLDTLIAQNLEKEKQEKFTARMESLDSVYELTKEDREIIAKNIKDLNDESFAGYSKELEVLLKEKNKKVIEAKKVTLASVEPPKVENPVNQAINNATPNTPVIPNSQPPEETLTQKFAKAFSLEEGWEISLDRK